MEAKQAILTKRREELQARRDALVARYSQGITDYDREGQEKHKEIEKWTKKEKEGYDVRENAGQLIKEVVSAVERGRKMSC